MAFEIGERITSAFTGPGTIAGPLERDEDGIAVQCVTFDNPLFGTKLRGVGKMQPLYEDEVKAKAPRVNRSTAGTGVTHIRTSKPLGHEGCIGEGCPNCPSLLFSNALSDATNEFTDAKGFPREPGRHSLQGMRRAGAQPEQIAETQKFRKDFRSDWIENKIQKEGGDGTQG